MGCSKRGWVHWGGGGVLLETKTNIFNKIQLCTANLQLLGKALISLGILRKRMSLLLTFLPWNRSPHLAGSENFHRSGAEKLQRACSRLF